MKKKILLLMGILSIGILLYAQVGINTQSPQSLVHIDGKGDTSGSNNITDDVVINNQGNIGIGVLSPTAKVHISTSGTPAMRIVDGTQGLDKILRTDVNGNASWVKKPSTDGKIYNINPSSAVTYNTGVSTLLLAMPVTESGNFLVTVRWWGVSNSLDGNGVTSAWFYLLEGSNTSNNWATDQSLVQDRTEYYNMPAKAGGIFCFALSLYTRASAGKYLKVYINVAVGGPWRIGTVGNSSLWNPSIIVYRV